MPNKTFSGARFAGRPLLMHAPRMGELLDLSAPSGPGLLSRIADHIPLIGSSNAAAGANKVQALYAPASAQVVEPSGRGLYSLADDIAVIDIVGPLLDRGYASEYAFCWGYDFIAKTARAIADDDRAKAVFIRLDSPGGMVAGVHEAFAALANLCAAGKPVHTYSPSICASAAMWLAAGTDHIAAAPTANLGSIGVVWVHYDESAWLNKMGIEITPIQFGDKKTDAAWWKALSEQAKSDAQAEIDTVGEMFIAAVSAGRGLDAQAVRDQQAGVFMGAAAVNAGLADSISLEDPAFAALRDQINQNSGGVPAAIPAAAALPAKASKGQSRPASDAQKESDMAGLQATLDKILGGRGKNLTSGQFNQIRAAAMEDEDTETPVGDEDEEPTAEDSTDEEGGDEDTMAEDSPDEDEEESVEARVLKRITAITGCKEAVGREKLAAKLASQPGMTFATARAILRTAPTSSSLGAQMSGQDPSISNSGGNVAHQSTTTARAAARWGKKKGA